MCTKRTVLVISHLSRLCAHAAAFNNDLCDAHVNVKLSSRLHFHTGHLIKA